MGRADIDTFDLVPTADRVRRSNPAWTAQQVANAECLYRAYLRSRFDRQQGQGAFIAIDKRADVFWHEHILDTTKYTNDCNLIFGSYLHHSPLGGSPTSPAFLADRQAYINQCALSCRGIVPDVVIICGH
jgi:hypothetical protein